MLSNFAQVDNLQKGTKLSHGLKKYEIYILPTTLQVRLTATPMI